MATKVFPEDIFLFTWDRVWCELSSLKVARCLGLVACSSASLTDCCKTSVLDVFITFKGPLETVQLSVSVIAPRFCKVLSEFAAGLPPGRYINSV